MSGTGREPTAGRAAAAGGPARPRRGQRPGPGRLQRAAPTVRRRAGRGHRRLPHPGRPAHPRVPGCDQGARVTACTHLGRPKGAPDPRCDLGPVREELARLAPQVELLENLRFDPGETANDPAFVEKLVNGHDAYVNDAFGVSHRAPRLGGRSAQPSCPVPPGSSWTGRSRSWAACSATRHGPSWPWWAGPRWPTSSACSRPCSTGSTPWWSVGAWPSPSWPPRATTSAARWSTATASTSAPRCSASGKPILLPDRHRGPRAGGRVRLRLHRGRGPHGRGRRARRLAGPGHRARDASPPSPSAIAGAGTVLWNGPMGVFEDAGSAPARPAWPRPWPMPGFTVVGGGDSAAAVDELGPGRPDRLHLHRRGGLARAARVRRPARAWPPSGARPTPPAPGRPRRAAGRRPGAPAAGERQLEDEPRPPRGHPRRPGPRPAPAARPTSARSTSRSTRRSPTCARSRRCSRPRASRWPSGPRTAPSRTPGPSPARSAR